MTIGTGIIAGGSVSHENADLETIEASSAASHRAGVEELLEAGASEAFVLQTCNRAEAYVVAEDAASARTVVDGFFPADVGERFGHEASLRQLMRVACGLESLVVGEDQIIGQLRDAYHRSKASGAVGPILDEAILKALHVGERAREETGINEGVVSLGSAAVELAADELELSQSTALVVGAGEMSTLAAAALEGNVDRLVVANRTRSRAERLAGELECEATGIGLSAVPDAVGTADLLITATGSDEPILAPETLSAADELLAIDLARPRDIDPAVGTRLDVRDLDALETVTEETRRQRARAAETVEAMIDEEFEHLIAQYKRKRADQVISAMYEGAERMKSQELRTAVSKLESAGELTDEQRDVVEAMADSLVGQLLSAPTKSLRDAAEHDDWETINTALQLFDPELRPDAMPSVPEGAGDARQTTGDAAVSDER